ncbi:Metal-dependent hydrolase YbeY, involved in rRNA and/or ribosome maturation and assembly [hydrothermal vent metagenome]|uniref:Metal-dependent hydrolase YbeY, involved in rRNA and/or ribosome maturation and assembly n=1 Tax=hydrothermal vent metagenome TaxID=652676 RepID=A0A1W1BZ80_9ZZZZ
MLIIEDNQTNFTTPLDILEKISSSFTTREIELIVTDALTIQDINATYRDKNSPTDVLSFPLEGDFMPLGSIIICIDFVYDKAKIFGHSDEEEFTLLFIHGLLHLLGFDHEIDNGEMRDKEEEIIEKFSLPKSLIVRTIY